MSSWKESLRSSGDTLRPCFRRTKRVQVAALLLSRRILPSFDTALARGAADWRNLLYASRACRLRASTLALGVSCRRTTANHPSEGPPLSRRGEWPKRVTLPHPARDCYSLGTGMYRRA